MARYRLLLLPVLLALCAPSLAQNEPAPPPPPFQQRPASTPPAPVEEAELPDKLRPGETLEAGVTIRTEGGQTIEEYRQGGRIYMVRVVPEVGIPYYLYPDPITGRLERHPFDRDGHVRPVHFRIFSW